MLMRAPLDIRSLIEARRPGYTLEAPFYTSREVFDLDLDAIFGRHWIFAGLEAEVPRRWRLSQGRHRGAVRDPRARR